MYKKISSNHKLVFYKFALLCVDERNNLVHINDGNV